MGGSPLSELVGGLAKARQILDLLHQRRAGTTVSVVTVVCAGGDQLQDARFGAPKEVLSFFVRVARARSIARGLLVPRRHLYFSAG